MSLLGLLLLLALPVVVQAQFNYTTDNGTITITGYTGPGGAVAIPDTINGLPVTRIGDEAFYNHTSLTSVTIPNSVTSIEDGTFSFCTSLTCVMIPNSITSIGNSAFFSCTSLTSVTIPNSVTSLGYGAFAGCTSLTSVTIPDSVTSIGGYAFIGCTGLSAITVGALNSFYSSVDGVLFNQSQTQLIECPGGKAGSYTIPNSVTSIGDWAFDSCDSLTSVTIPNSVTSLGDAAFESCTSLTSVTIPNSVTSIGYGAFTDCTSLMGVYFQGNAPSLGVNGFAGANNATVYYLPGTTGWGTTFEDRPTALWVLPYPLILNKGPSVGVQSNGFVFIISWATNVPVVVEACTNLANPLWSPVGTNTLTDGTSYFIDPQWADYPSRFYRLRSP